LISRATYSLVTDIEPLSAASEVVVTVVRETVVLVSRDATQGVVVVVTIDGVAPLKVVTAPISTVAPVPQSSIVKCTKV